MRSRLVGVIAVLGLALPSALLMAGAPVSVAAVSTPVAGGVRARAVAGTELPLPDTGLEGEWWFASWQMSKVWAAGARGQGVSVAVIDSGVNARRPELAGHVLKGTDFAGGDGRTDDDQPGGHGTAMALLIAGQGGPSGLVGVAPDSKILPVNYHHQSNGLASAIRWVVDHGAKVVSISVGSSGSCLPAQQDAVQYAIAHGSVVVAAPGNTGPNSQVISSPANCAGVVTVGAVDAHLRVWGGSSTGPQVDLAAPGVHMASMDRAGKAMHSSGTSDSTALTSGVIALVWSKFPRLTSRQVVARVLATARDVPPAGRDDATGYGVVRPYQAVTADVPADAPNPVYDALATVAAASPTASAAGAAAPPSRYPSWLLPVVVGVAGIGVLLLVVLLAVGVVRRDRGSRGAGGVSPPGRPPQQGAPSQPGQPSQGNTPWQGNTPSRWG